MRGSTTVQKWGNNLAVRIPRAVAQDIHLHQGSVVDIALVAGKIVVKPRRQRHDTLAELLRGMTTRHRHAALDWGGRVGQEAWSWPTRMIPGVAIWSGWRSPLKQGMSKPATDLRSFCLQHCTTERLVLPSSAPARPR